jgi:ribosomal protein S19E (S16A)
MEGAVTVTETDRSTVARQREFHDLMEKFIGNRRRAFIPRSKELAAELGVSEATLPFLQHLRQIAEGDFVPLERLKRRLCYSAREGWRDKLAELVSGGFAEKAGEGWRLTPRGLHAIETVWANVYEQLRALPLPTDVLRRTVAALDTVVGPATGDEYDRLTMIRRCAPAGGRNAEDAVRIEQLFFETCVLLDDGHIQAWRRAGYRGPELDVLTKVWYGANTRDAVKKALSYSQAPEHVDAHIEELVKRGDLEVEGEAVRLTEQGRRTRDRIEKETDRDGLARWPKGADLEALMADVAALVAVLPPEDQLPKGPTH